MNLVICILQWIIWKTRNYIKYNKSIYREAIVITNLKNELRSNIQMIQQYYFFIISILHLWTIYLWVPGNLKGLQIFTMNNIIKSINTGTVVVRIQYHRTYREHNICRLVNNSDVSLWYQFCENITFILYIIYNVRYNINHSVTLIGSPEMYPFLHSGITILTGS
jgi:hypothetical protein